MNKQKLIEKYESLKGIWNSPGSIPALECFLQDLYQLTEPQKVVIPKFVAEYIKEYKETNQNIYNLLTEYPPEIGSWLDGNYKKRLDTFARAWLDCYEIEKEKLYTVEIPDPHNHIWMHTVLSRAPKGLVRVCMINNSEWKSIRQYHLTEAQIKKDFEWAWQFAKPVEEVE
ncbi:DUF1642 domain-containing protein [Streptococcus entericus]|uniref:DUF1642 domain-containing protein n=1 Tax=Streptococcus entericus TaxID=155680 RepID=UPI00037DE5F0|nr:DUF1642 domain-containing protein [Streptococcus entericus]